MELEDTRWKSVDLFMLCILLLYSVYLVRGRSDEDTIEDLSRPHHRGFDTIISHGESAVTPPYHADQLINTGQEDNEPKKRKLRPSRHLETC